MRTKERLLRETALTPGECVVLFGRSAKFWRNVLDKGKVRGSVNGRRRLLNREDCAELIAGTLIPKPTGNRFADWRARELANLNRKRLQGEQKEAHGCGNSD